MDTDVPDLDWFQLIEVWERLDTTLLFDAEWWKAYVENEERSRLDNV